jgi:hypothetical protein
MAFAVAAFAVQRGAKPSESCALLTAAEIGAAVGGAAGQPHDTDMGGQASRSCMWGPTANQGMVTYSVFRAAQGPERERGLAKLHQVTETLKARGWKEEKQAFGSATCSTLTPPASEENAPATTGCLAEARGMAIAVSYMGKKGVPVENIKTLLDRIVSRLP